MTGEDGADAIRDPQPPVQVRTLLLTFAAEVLGQMAPADVPASLRQVHRFAPRRRATAGAVPLWSALERDEGFRSHVAAVWARTRPEVSPGDTAGQTPDDAVEVVDDVESAAGAWLLRPEGWRELVSSLPAAEPPTDEALAAGAAPLLARAERAEAEAVRLAVALAAAEGRLLDAQEEVATLRREGRRLRADADRARNEAREATARAATVLAEAREARDAAEAARSEAASSRREAEELRRDARETVQRGRDLASVRTRLLLDTIVDAGIALRADLALPPAGTHPADLVAPPDTEGPDRPTSRGRSADDPALLDELLALPHAHLVVDGYNVTKTAWPELTLAEQRGRLVDALGNLAGRTGAEVTCCFDGQEGPRPGVAAGRAVRVRFSVGEIADDLIRRLVRAEPRGRVVVVVTSDQRLGADLEAAGARVVPSATLVARFARL